MNDYSIVLLILANIGLNVMIYFRIKYEHKRTRKELQEIKTRQHWIKWRQKRTEEHPSNYKITPFSLDRVGEGRG